MNKKLFGFIFGLVVFGLFLVSTVSASTPSSLITSLVPTEGKIGTTVEINGGDFTGVSKVYFGGIEGGYFSVTPTKISIIVPKGAITGKVSVLTSGGEFFSPADFTVITLSNISIAPISVKSTSVDLVISGTFTEDYYTLNLYDVETAQTSVSPVDSKIINKTQIFGDVNVSFSGLKPKNHYMGKIISGGNTFTVNFVTPLDFSVLNGTITSANERLDAKKEAATAQKDALKAAISKAEYTSTGGSSIFQSDIDKAVSDLQYAMNNFELNIVGTGGSVSDTSTDTGTTKKVDYSQSIVPRCNVGGVTEIDPKTGQYKVPCDFTFFMKLINNVIKFLLFVIATPFVALIIIYIAYLFLTSGGKSGQVEKAKHILMNVVVGYVIALAAWLIISTIITSMKVDSDINTFMGPLKK